MAVKRKSPRSTSATKTARPHTSDALRARRPDEATTKARRHCPLEWQREPSIESTRASASRGLATARTGSSSVLKPLAWRPTGPFRGKDDGIKPQGARFRVFQVDIDANENETVRREVTGAPDVQIEWTVQLANRKAAARRDLWHRLTGP